MESVDPFFDSKKKVLTFGQQKESLDFGKQKESFDFWTANREFIGIRTVASTLRQ